MRVLSSIVGLGLVIATPAMALTVSSAPNRDALPHLKPVAAAQGVDIRDSWLSSDRPRTGLGYGERPATYTDSPQHRYAPLDPTRRLDGSLLPLSPTGADLQRLRPRR